MGSSRTHDAGEEGGVSINKKTARFTRSKDLSGNVFPCGREEFGVGGLSQFYFGI